MPDKDRVPNRLFRNLLLTLAVIGLVVSVATRYCDVWVPIKAVSALNDSGVTKHQHLDSDAFEWTPTASDFSQFVSLVCAPHVAPAAEPILVVHVDDSLYNRPPPAC